MIALIVFADGSVRFFALQVRFPFTSCAAIRRGRMAFVPPVQILLKLCEQLPECEVRGTEVVAVNPADPDEVFAVTNLYLSVFFAYSGGFVDVTNCKRLPKRLVLVLHHSGVACPDVPRSAVMRLAFTDLWELRSIQARSNPYRGLSDRVES